MEYPHWLIVAGAVLLSFGFIWLAFRRRDAEAELEKTAYDDKPWHSESQDKPSADRQPMLAERKREVA